MNQEEKIDWVTIVPIDGRIEIEESRLPFDLGNGVQIEKTPDWIKEEEFKTLFSPHHFQNISDSIFSFVKKYRASSLGDPDITWKSTPPRSIQSTASESILFADLALWLVAPLPIGGMALIHGNKLEQGWHWRETSIRSPIRIQPKDTHRIINVENLDQAKTLSLVINQLKREGALWIAFHRLIRGLWQDDWILRYMILWIVLEALFSPTDGELSFRLCQRISFFTTKDKKESGALFKKLREYYRHRSKTVHGLGLKIDSSESEKVMDDCEEVIRQAFNKILSDPILIDKFLSESKRNEYLDSLTFA